MTERHPSPSLEAPAAALVARYAGRYSPDVVRRRLIAAHDRLAGTARVPDFLPIFAEREARRELDRDAPPPGERPPRPRAGRGGPSRAWS